MMNKLIKFFKWLWSSCSCTCQSSCTDNCQKDNCSCGCLKKEAHSKEPSISEAVKKESSQLVSKSLKESTATDSDEKTTSGIQK